MTSKLPSRQRPPCSLPLLPACSACSACSVSLKWPPWPLGLFPQTLALAHLVLTVLTPLSRLSPLDCLASGPQRLTLLCLRRAAYAPRLLSPLPLSPSEIGPDGVCRQAGFLRCPSKKAALLLRAPRNILPGDDQRVTNSWTSRSRLCCTEPVMKAQTLQTLADRRPLAGAVRGSAKPQAPLAPLASWPSG